MNALALIRAATEPSAPMTWSDFCARFQTNRQAVTRSHGHRFGVEVHKTQSAGPQDGTIFVQDLDIPPAKRELLSFRIMNNKLTLQSHGNYLFSVGIYEALRKHPTPTSLVKYLFELIDEYADKPTSAEAATEPQEKLTWRSFCAGLPDVGDARNVRVGRFHYAVHADNLVVWFNETSDELDAVAFIVERYTNLVMYNHGNQVFETKLEPALRTHSTSAALLRYLAQLVHDHGSNSRHAEAAAEPADEPNSTTAPGLMALIRRSSSDQARALEHMKHIGDKYVGVGACVTPRIAKPGLLLFVTDEEQRVIWSFIVRAMPTKYMVQFLGLGRRDRLKADITKDAAWRNVRNGDLGDLSMPAEALLSRAIQVSIDYVRRNEDRPEYVAVVKGAAEPAKDAEALWDAIKVSIKSLKSGILESNGHKMAVYILSDGALFADTHVKPDEASITVTLAPSTPDNLVLEFKGATFAAGRSRHSTQHKIFSTRNETAATLRKKILAELFNTMVSNIRTMRERLKAAQ